MAAYNGSSSGDVLRSLSGKTPLASKNASDEISYAIANNEESQHIWYTDVYCDYILTNLLLLLIGKSTDTQKIFGVGLEMPSAGPAQSGEINKKGIFWGTNNSNEMGVKIFGIEHFWGNEWRRLAGWIYNKGTHKLKMTYGKRDGTTTENGYNLDGSGYITISGSITGPSTSSSIVSGYIKKMLFSEYGLIPINATGSESTYYADEIWFNEKTPNYALIKRYGSGISGTFCLDINTPNTEVSRGGGASLSCKPLKSTWEV